jgi:hypothetical protein
MELIPSNATNLTLAVMTGGINDLKGNLVIQVLVKHLLNCFVHLKKRIQLI